MFKCKTKSAFTLAEVGNTTFEGLQLKLAFTLAEVLIALAIIGVIAAMTLPALINKINNAEIVAGVKKYQSLLNQAVTKYAVDNGCIGNLSACTAFMGDDDTAGHTTAWNALKPYFNVTKNCGTDAGQGCFPKGVMYKYLNGGDRYIVDDQPFAKASLVDGASIWMHDYGGNCNSNNSKSNKDPLSHACGDFL